MKKVCSGLGAFAFLGASLGISLPVSAQTNTYKSIPLDCGGWFSGFAVHSSGRIYGYGDVYGAWRSDNAGQSWKSLQDDFVNGYPNANYGEAFVNGMDVAKGNADKVVFLTPSRLWRSADGGTTWAEALSGLTVTRVRGATPVFFHPTNDNDLWVAARRSGLTGSLWRSSDGGTNWSKVGGTTFDAARASTIYVRPEFPNQVWVGTAGALYVSTDGGTTWTQVWNNGGANNPITGQPSVVKAIVRRSDGIGYMATDVGGYRITASDWANPASYNFNKTVSWWNGWGPSNAAVLSNGNFVSGGDGDRNPANFSDLRDAARISSDGGQTWAYMPLNFSTPPTPSWAQPATLTSKADGGRDMIVQDPTNASRWFMTTGKAPLVSNDSGNNWKFVPNQGGLAGVMTYKVHFARSSPNLAFIPSSDMGSFVVNDAGAGGGVASCSRRTDTTMITVHDVMSSDDGQILVAAGTNQSANTTYINRSTNGGVSWSSLNLTGSGLPANYQGITRAVMAPGNPNDFVVVMGSGDSPSNPGMWRTTNGGTTFTQVNGIPAGLDTGSRYHQENSYLETDGVNLNTRYFAVRPNYVYRSTDAGANWTQVTTPFGSANIDGFAVDRATAGKLWVAGNYEGIKTSTNGGTNWTSVSGFIEARRVDAANGKVAVWGRRAGDTWLKIYYSPDNGTTWQEKTGPNARFPFLRELAVDPWRAGQIWVSGISVNVINGPAQSPNLRAIETFDYAQGTLADKEGGEGWQNAWDTTANTIEATGLDYTSGDKSLNVSGRAASVDAGRQSFRTLSANHLSGEHWLAFLAQANTAGSGYGGVALFDGTSERVFIGQRFNQSNWGIERTGTGQNSTVGTTTKALIVVKMTLGAGSATLRMWVNPPLGTTPSDASANVTLSNVSLLSFNRVRLAGSTFMKIDELRLGEDFASVTPYTQNSSRQLLLQKRSSPSAPQF